MNAGTAYSPNEHLLLSQLREGDQRAFNYFYERHSLVIYRKLKKMVRVDTLADELMQDVFVRLWDKRHLIDPEKPLKAYLFLIAQNIVYDFYRKVSREGRLQSEITASFVEAYDHSEETLFLKETQELLEKAVDNLPAQQQLVFRLCKFEGKTYEQVSEELNISTSTINGHIVRATKSVKAFMLNYNNVAVHILIASVIASIGEQPK
ncbi:sigma-70 family RNA polymerase sigma factor [Mucilaginibacter sp.]|uniref:RNA polymerase sigma factor n=1 Tax=Mucilaginibacter sp. TaxID=1882438 RepID=UPI00326741C1